jgi:hypothetical protein
MIDRDTQKIVDKLQKLKALHRARARVRQLEWELSGEPARPEDPPYVPQFLRQRIPLRLSGEIDSRLAEERALLAAGQRAAIGRAA